MKRLLSSVAFVLGAAVFLGLASGSARADGPAAPLPKGPGPAVAPAVLAAPAAAPVADKAMTPPAAAPVVMAPATVITSAPVTAAACAAPACEAPSLKKVCVPGTDVRTISKRVYGEVCEDFCVPKCSLTGGLFKLGGHGHDDGGTCPAEGCADGSCAKCEHKVKQRKYLVVKIKKEEQTYNKCSVEYQLEEPKGKKGCADGTCLPPATETIIMESPAAKMPAAEKVPAPKTK